MLDVVIGRDGAKGEDGWDVKKREGKKEEGGRRRDRVASFARRTK